MRACVVIPTYNERENILTLAGQALSAHPDLHILVVDDDSPDGTGTAMEAYSQSEPRAHVLRRPGRLGYGSALSDGFRWALDQDAELILSMDADFSHDPRHLPEMLEKIQDRDIVIGSRYVPGGGIENWGVLRRLLSAGANRVARTLLGLPVHDCTGGYRCYRREVVLQSDIMGVPVEGYGFLVATLFRCHQMGFRIGEIPIRFIDRRYGQSKLSKRIIIEAVFVVFRLFLQRLRSVGGRP